MNTVIDTEKMQAEIENMLDTIPNLREDIRNLKLKNQSIFGNTFLSEDDIDKIIHDYDIDLDCYEVDRDFFKKRLEDTNL